MQTVVRRRATKRAVVAHVQFDVVLRDATEVRVIATGSHRASVVRRRSDRSGDERVHAVSTDHHLRPLLDCGATPASPAHADDGVSRHQQLVDGERVPNLDTAFRCRLHQKTVKYGAPGAEPAQTIIRIRDRAAEREWSDIERHPSADRRQIGRGKRIEESPPRKDLGAVWPQDVCRDRIAREGCPVDEQDLESLASQEHGGRRACASRADNDGVVHVNPLASDPN